MAKFLNVFVGSRLRKTPRFTSLAAFFLVFGSALWGYAEAIQVSKAEYQLLPAYCRNQGNVAPSYFKPDSEVQWRNRLGSEFTHIHHYCWGIVGLNRAYKAGHSAQEREYLFSVAVQDFLYVIERARPDFALLPEMYTRLGEAYLGLRNDKNAELAFQKAWEVNPAYWPPYVWWSQRLLSQGKNREALVVAEEGKKNAPESKALDNLIDEIKKGGKAAWK